jgi:hypothetical protein
MSAHTPMCPPRQHNWARSPKGTRCVKCGVFKSQPVKNYGMLAALTGRVSDRRDPRDVYSWTRAN